MRIIFRDNEMELHPSGVLLWPAEKLLIVSDLHLEKSSHFARRGFFLPPYESQTDLERLHKILQNNRIERILMLGDCFHDDQGYARMSVKNSSLFESLMEYAPIWIRGNHDSRFFHAKAPVYDEYKIGNICFRHEADTEGDGEISGHYHPKITIEYKGGFISRPCFIADERKMILPSFGSLTGGLNIQNPAIAEKFPGPINVYVAGGSKIHALKI